VTPKPLFYFTIILPRKLNIINLLPGDKVKQHEMSDSQKKKRNKLMIFGKTKMRKLILRLKYLFRFTKEKKINMLIKINNTLMAWNRKTCPEKTLVLKKAEY